MDPDRGVGNQFPGVSNLLATVTMGTLGVATADRMKREPGGGFDINSFIKNIGKEQLLQLPTSRISTEATTKLLTTPTRKLPTTTTTTFFFPPTTTPITPPQVTTTQPPSPTTTQGYPSLGSLLNADTRRHAQIILTPSDSATTTSNPLYSGGNGVDRALSNWNDGREAETERMSTYFITESGETYAGGPLNEPDSLSTTSMGILTSYIVGLLLGICIIALIAYCTYRRRKGPKRGSSPTTGTSITSASPRNRLEEAERNGRLLKGNEESTNDSISPNTLSDDSEYSYPRVSSKKKSTHNKKAQTLYEIT